MKRFTLTVAIILYLLNSASGQKKTYVGFEFSVANDIYKITDNGDYLINIPLINGQGGFISRQEVTKTFFIEAGVLMKYYQEGFGSKTIPYYSSSSGSSSWLIPVRFGLHLNLYKEKFYLVPVVGYTFGINPPYGYGLGNGKQTSRTTTINYDYTENPDVSRYFSLFQTGIGFEIRLFRAMLFSISSSYYKGFNNTTHLDINYTVNNSNQATGTAITKGDFWCVTTGIKYPISNFWTK